MNIKDLSVCFRTNNIEESKEYYIKNFNASVTFDCSWYVVLAFGGQKQFAISLMIPQDERPLFDGHGITLNFKVDDVDAEYERLISQNKLTPINPLSDNPWGDRSFTILDPLGNTLYIYSDIETSDEYKFALK